MSDSSEYRTVLEFLYDRSLILEDTTQFHPVLSFYFIDALAHIDYTAGLLAYHYQSPKIIMTGEYLRWRIDEEKKGDRARFPSFIKFLKERHPDRFGRLPTLWRRIYDPSDPASYRSFRISLDPSSPDPISPSFFIRCIQEFFDKEFLKSIYTDASLAGLFDEFCRSAAA